MPHWVGQQMLGSKYLQQMASWPRLMGRSFLDWVGGGLDPVCRGASHLRYSAVILSCTLWEGLPGTRSLRPRLGGVMWRPAQSLTEVLSPCGVELRGWLGTMSVSCGGSMELCDLRWCMRSRYFWDFLAPLIDSRVRPGCSSVSSLTMIHSSPGSHRTFTCGTGRFSAWKTFSCWVALVHVVTWMLMSSQGTCGT